MVKTLDIEAREETFLPFAISLKDPHAIEQHGVWRAGVE
jgi:hypothetical protein